MKQGNSLPRQENNYPRPQSGASAVASLLREQEQVRPPPLVPAPAPAQVKTPASTSLALNTPTKSVHFFSQSVVR